MAEGNGLENRRRETVREFESLLLRHHFLLMSQYLNTLIPQYLNTSIPHSLLACDFNLMRKYFLNMTSMMVFAILPGLSIYGVLKMIYPDVRWGSFWDSARRTG